MRRPFTSPPAPDWHRPQNGQKLVIRRTDLIAREPPFAQCAPCRILYVRSTTAGFNAIAIHACRAPAIAAVVKDTKSAKAKAQKANGVRSV
jgi:hypothetical protein